MANLVEILIKAQDDASRVVQHAQGNIANFAKAAAVASATVGLAAAGVGVASVKMAGDFQKGMAEVATLFEPTQQELESLSTGVLGLSKRLGTDAVASTKALYQAISAGVPAGNALEFMEVASKAAIAGVTDTETAVNGLTNIINAFGLKTSDATAVADSMFAAVKGGKTTFGELSASIFQVAPVAASLGVSFKEVNAALEAVTKQGVPTAVATTQVRQAMVELQKPGKELSAILEAAGIADAKAAIGAEGFATVLGKVAAAADKQGLSMNQIFGSVEAASAANLLAGKNAQFFTDALKNQEAATGSTSKAFDTMAGTFNQQLKILKSTLDTTLITLGTKLLPVITPLIAAVAEKLPAAFALAESAVRTLIGFIESNVVPAFSAFMEQANNMSLALQPLAEAITANIQPILIGLAAALLAVVVPAFGAWAVAAALAAKATIVALAPVLWPIAAIGLAVALLAKGWGENWGDIQGKVQAVWEFIAPVLGEIYTELSRFWTEIQPLLSAAWDAISSKAKEAMDAVSAIVTAVMGAVTAFWQEHWDTISAVLLGAWAAMRLGVETVWAIISGIIKAGLQVLAGDWSGAWRTIEETVATVWANIITLMTSILPQIAENAEKIGDAIFSGVVGALVGLGQALLDSISGAIRAIDIDLGWIRISGLTGVTFNIPMPSIPLPSFPRQESPQPPTAWNGGWGPAGYQHGGIVPGPIGTPRLAVVHGGEVVTPVGGVGGITYQFDFRHATVHGIDDLEDMVVRALETAKRRRPGLFS